MTKSLEGYFADWEGHVFGFGYGTGEPHVIPALRRFLELCSGEHHRYDYQELERELGPVVAWLLINALIHADIFEYGTSPRFAWLTQKGLRLKAFVLSKTNDELIEITNWDAMSGDYEGPCYPDACNCGPNGYEEGRICQNPFWLDPK